MDLQFDLLVAAYVDGALASNRTRQNHPVDRAFQISQVMIGPNRSRLDLMFRSLVNYTHVYTRYNLADSNNSDAYYANNPLAEELKLLNMYANAQDVYRFYQVNIGLRERPLIVLQLFFSKNATTKERDYDAHTFLNP